MKHRKAKPLLPALLLFLTACCSMPAVTGAVEENLAGSANYEGSSRVDNVSNLFDGIKQVDGTGEWIGGSPNAWYGWISYPTLQLKWETPQKINKVVLYDRPTLEEHMAACILKFSDGSEGRMSSPFRTTVRQRPIVFEPREVTAMKLDVVDGIGEHIGLSELEVLLRPRSPARSQTGKELHRFRFLRRSDHRDRARTLVLLHPRQPPVRHGLCLGLYPQQEPGWRRLQLQQHRDPWLRQDSRLDHVRHQHHAVTGEVNPNLGEKGWKSSFSHDTEIIEPGYHKLFLDRYKTQVEYTSTDRMAFYRLTYREAAKANSAAPTGRIRRSRQLRRRQGETRQPHPHRRFPRHDGSPVGRPEAVACLFCHGTGSADSSHGRLERRA